MSPFPASVMCCTSDDGRVLSPRPRPAEATTGVRTRGETGHSDLAPVHESTTPPSRGESVVTVSRSRTLPSRTSRPRTAPTNAPPSEDEAHPKVLKKHKRTSAQPQPRPGADG